MAERDADNDRVACSEGAHVTETGELECRPPARSEAGAGLPRTVGGETGGARRAGLAVMSS